MKREYIRTDRVAEELDVSVRTVRRWIKTGELESFKIGHTRYVPVQSLEKKRDNCGQLVPESSVKRV